MKTLTVRLKILTTLIMVSCMLFGMTMDAYAVGHDIKIAEEKDTLESNRGEFRGVWFSFRDWQAMLQGKSESDFRDTVDAVCANCASNGMNNIFVHVRSHNDAIYPSAIYPWSTEMLSGYDPGFDPLAIFVESAHRYGLKIHAWINPYGYRNNEYCGDASLATHDNIIAGVSEILEHYAVDGIHFDDYFPPIGASLHNVLLRDVYEVSHAYGKVFGVSPGGNIDNNLANGAEVTTWMSQKGYIDYICPQLYWTDNYGSGANVTMFSDRLAAWRRLDTAGIPMYIGLAMYKAGDGSGSDPGWKQNSNNIANQVLQLRSAGCGGFVIYSYSSMVSSAAAAEMQNFRGVL